MRVLEVDSELGEALNSARLERARLDALAHVRSVPPGTWTEPDWPDSVRNGFGLLVLDGLLVRNVTVAGREGAELLSAGDLLRPWQHDDAAASVLRTSDWKVLEAARFALLDARFALRVAPYPEIASQLIARALRRARYFAVIIAIIHQPRVDQRLLMLLWHLADRCGKVGPEGVLVPMQLTHSVLAELLAARRPTVSGALAALERADLIGHSPDGWLLRGAPPGEISALGAVS